MPSPSAHPNGGDARIGRTLGLPNKKSVKEDSRIEMSSDSVNRVPSGTAIPEVVDSSSIVNKIS